MEKPVCGTYIRLEWLKDELYKHLQNSMSDTEKKDSVGWYMSYGFARGFECKMDFTRRIECDNRK